MADKKISQLTGATTPLAGTEVLPIVQGGSTVKVSVANLTAGRAVSASSVTAGNLTSGRVATVGTSGLIQDDADLQFNGQDLGVGTAPKTWSAADFYGLQVGKGVAVFGRGSGDQDRGGLTANAYQDGSWKRIASGNATQYYQNDGNHTFYTAVSGTADSAISWVEVAEIDEANKNLKVSAGNLIVGTAGKGIDFSVNTHAAGMTSELLDWYEEGTWSPIVSDAETGGNNCTMTAGFTFGSYTRIGRLVTVQGSIRIDSVSGVTTANTAYITGLPFAPASAQSGLTGGCVVRAAYVDTPANCVNLGVAVRSSSTMTVNTSIDAGASTTLTIDNIQSTNSNHYVAFVASYYVA